MQLPKQRTFNRRAVFGWSAMICGMIAPAAMAAPALENAAQKRNAPPAAAQVAAVEEKKADQKTEEALSFDPFAATGAAAPAAASSPGVSAAEQAARQAARDAVLNRLVSLRSNFVVMMKKVRAHRRSPHGPPPSTPRRPFDPPGPPPHVPPGPPDHAPPGPPR